MTSITINYIDGTSNTFNEKMGSNLSELVKWLSNNDNVPLSVITNTRTIILYKHAIKSAELF